MLVLSRKRGESIRIGRDVELVVLETRGGTVRLGLVAPAEVAIQRQEIRQRMPVEATDEAAEVRPMSSQD